MKSRICSTVSMLLPAIFAALLAFLSTQKIEAQCYPSPYNANGGTNTISPCVGQYFGYVRAVTNGAVWFVAPTNVTTGTFTNISGLAPTNCAMFVLQKNNMQTWCGTNSVTFPAANPYMFQLTMYIKTPQNPFTNGQPVNLQIIWK